MSAWLPRPAYWLARRALPIACVDVLVLREGDAGPEVGLIRRVGGDGATEGWALVGGRVLRGESLVDAVDRHLVSTLGDVTRSGPLDPTRPVHVAEYSPDGRVGGRVDPAKHAIALAYVAAVTGTVEPRGEARGFAWFGIGATPPDEAYAFAHGGVVAELVRRDARLAPR